MSRCSSVGQIRPMDTYSGYEFLKEVSTSVFRSSLQQVATVAGALLLQIMEWLRSESVSRDVSIVGHLEGGKVTFQFILYHCKRRGTVNIWEEEDKWKETVKDERDEPVGILRSLDPVEPEVPEWLALELTRLLMQLTEKV